MKSFVTFSSSVVQLPVDRINDVTVPILLAAGAGTRFTGAGHKLDATIEGRSVAQRAITAALDSGVGPLLVVTGANRDHPAGRCHRGAEPRLGRRSDDVGPARDRGGAGARCDRSRRRARRPAVRHCRGVAGRRRIDVADRGRHVRRPTRQSGTPRRIGVASVAGVRRRGRACADPCSTRPRRTDTLRGFARRHRHRGGSAPMAEQLVNEFTVNRPIEEAWPVICDVERIAPCMPGAQLEEIEGDVYRGVVKIKLGAVSTQFKGQAQFVERDDVNHRAKSEGRRPRHRWAGERRRRHHRRCRVVVADEHQVHRHNRPPHHRQGGAVRPRHHGRRQQEADGAVRRRT